MQRHVTKAQIISIIKQTQMFLYDVNYTNAQIISAVKNKKIFLVYDITHKYRKHIINV
jgi:hypothetical protein